MGELFKFPSTLLHKFGLSLHGDKQQTSCEGVPRRFDDIMGDGGCNFGIRVLEGTVWTPLLIA